MNSPLATMSIVGPFLRAGHRESRLVFLVVSVLPALGQDTPRERRTLLLRAGRLRSGSLIERENYLRLSDVHAGSVDAHSYVRKSIAEGVRQAREHAGFTQAELAKKMGKSQTMVSQAESGAARISERYVTSVLKACGLPKDWVPKAKKRTKKG